jgi:nicotinate-nucleotide pyrophosphorylase (carboxylating)
VNARSDFDPPGPLVVDAVTTALREDLGVMGDITSVACIDADASASACFVARDDGVLAGTALATEVFRQIDPAVEVTWAAADGDAIAGKVEIGRVTGSLRSILGGERVALNFLGHCSGIASTTRRYVDAAHGKARIRDTRKTLPGLRAIQKAAVRAGGGFNHRDSLSDAVLVKDNHLAVLGVTRAVDRARERWPGRIVEIECETLAQVSQACDAGADFVLLDNMAPDQVAEAVAEVRGRAFVEVSGSITLELVSAYADAGADFISVGALTHSVRNLDIGLDIPCS